MLPKFVTSYNDRHGALRFRFRRKADGLDAPLPPPTSPYFRRMYRACLDGAPIRVSISTSLSKVEAGKGYVYFVGSGRGPVKIGFSIDLRRRFYRLQVSSPVQLDLLAFVEGDLADEAAYHQRFAASRTSGEWFARTRELAAEIKRLRLALCLTGSEVRHELPDPPR